MLDAILFALQSIAPNDGGSSASISLLNPVQATNCKHSPHEIVVCSRGTDTYKLPHTDPSLTVGPMLPNAEWRALGDAKVSAHFREGAYGVPAFMMTITKPF